MMFKTTFKRGGHLKQKFMTPEAEKTVPIEATSSGTDISTHPVVGEMTTGVPALYF